MISCGIKQDHAIAIPSLVTKMYDLKENETEELSKAEDEIEEASSLIEPEMSEAFKVNENNPYAMYTETFSGGYLYDPLNNERLNFEWDIELSEMEGTDSLSEAMEEHQKEVKEMEPNAPRNETIGSNLFYYGWCTEGNGYIYTTNMAFYGEAQEDDSISTIYRFDKSKNQWEIVVSYAIPPEEYLRDESGGIIYDRYVHDLTYYKGYVYYILVTDYAPGGGSGKEYYFYRASERNGKVEKIGEGFERFHIYNNKIYFMTHNYSDQISYFGEMDINGTNQEIEGDSLSWVDGENFTVGGGSLYWVDGNNNIRAINLETKKGKIFAINLDRIEGIYYEDGNLYILAAYIYQLDLGSGNIKKVVKTIRDTAWICSGYLYYVDQTTNDDYFIYCFWRRDLLTDEVIKWHEILIPRNTNIYVSYVHLEVAGNNILVQVVTSYLTENEDDSKYEYSYLMKNLDEITNYSCR